MTRESASTNAHERRWGATVSLVVIVALLAASCSGSATSTEPTADPISGVTDQPASTMELDLQPDDTVVETGSRAQESGPEFIDLAYWEGVPADTYRPTLQPPEECDSSDPLLLVCDFEADFPSIGTHIGLARDVATGTITTVLSEECEGPNGQTGNPQIQDTRGTITTDRGDELWFHNLSETCSANIYGNHNWRVVGGTGRFEDASGLMTAVFPVFETGYVAVSVGTLTVRADLWEPILPAVE